MKPILRLRNMFPMFCGILILGTLWKLVWGSLILPRVSSDGVIAKIAGAALVQWGVLLVLTPLSVLVIVVVI